MKVRLAKDGDNNQLSNLRLRFTIFEQQYVPGLSAHTNNRSLKKKLYRECKDSIKKRNPLFLVAEDNNLILGYLNFFIYPEFKDKVFLGELFVVPEYRRKGIANLILEALVKWSKNHHKKIIHVSLAEANKEANSFFAGKNFNKIKSNYINLEKKLSSE